MVSAFRRRLAKPSILASWAFTEKPQLQQQNKIPKPVSIHTDTWWYGCVFTSIHLFLCLSELRECSCRCKRWWNIMSNDWVAHTHTTEYLHKCKLLNCLWYWSRWTRTDYSIILRFGSISMIVSKPATAAADKVRAWGIESISLNDCDLFIGLDY